jgi:hypothetical protein
MTAQGPRLKLAERSELARLQHSALVKYRCGRSWQQRASAVMLLPLSAAGSEGAAA